MGGTMIAHPKVRPIFFMGDANAAQLGDFHQKLASSQYWRSVAEEYGVGAITPLPPVILGDAPPASITDDAIRSWLEATLTAGNVLGAADPDTLYALYYPAGTTVSLNASLSCKEFRGYHGETRRGTRVGYSVVPTCGSLKGLSESDALTLIAAHEIFEWATDPFPNSNPAFNGMEKDSLAWERAFLGELADLCTHFDWAGHLRPPDLGYLVQRMWSNKLAAAGHNPCAPKGTDEFFVGVPMVRDTVSFGAKGVKVRVGETVELPIQFHSDVRDAPEWTIQVVDELAFLGGADAGHIRYELAKDTGKHGDVLTVRISATERDDRVFFVVAVRGKAMHVWPGIVVAE